METSSPPDPSIHLLTALYHQLVHTLIEVLPPPRGDTPVGMEARKLSAIGKIAALAPLNADEADLAAHCIAARAQADEMLRLARLNEHDPALAARLSAEYRSTMRLWLAVYTRLKRVQAERRKRDANAETANEDAWARHIAERSMLAVLEAQPETAPAEPVRPHQAPVAGPEAAPTRTSVAAPIGASVRAPIVSTVVTPVVAAEKFMSGNDTHSHGVTFETKLNAQTPTPGSTGSGVENFRRILLSTTRLSPQQTETGPGPNGTQDLGHAPSNRRRTSPDATTNDNRIA